MIHVHLNMLTTEYLLVFVCAIILTDSGSGRVINELINTNYKSYSVSTQTYSENGNCIKEVTLNGPGIVYSDVFHVSCDSTSSIVLTTQSCFVYGNSKDRFALFSNSPGKLVILQNGECTLKEYTETETGVNTDFSKMSDEDCLGIKQIMEEEIEKNRVFWEEWNKNFTQELSNSFPPGFPFQNQPQPPLEATGFPGNQENSEGPNLWWQNWSQKFREKMQESFPPGFPFH